MILASIFFASLVIIVRRLRILPTFEILFFQCLLSMIFMPLLLKKNNVPLIGKNRIALFLRGFFSFSSLAFYYYALQNMNIASAVTLLQLSPFFIVILSAFFLKEKINRYQIPIILLAFTGALFIVKPVFGFDYVPALFGILAAFLAGSGQVMIRHLRLSNHPFVVINYLIYTMALLSLFFQICMGNFVMPTKFMLPDLFILGLLYFFGQIAITLAYFHLPASLVSLYKYSQILFATILGFIFFFELPDMLSFLGAALIIISGYLNYKFNFNKLNSINI
jgi:drug/metabolite transporter (DMT)-like permease